MFDTSARPFFQSVRSFSLAFSATGTKVCYNRVFFYDRQIQTHFIKDHYQVWYLLCIRILKHIDVGLLCEMCR